MLNMENKTRGRRDMKANLLAYMEGDFKSNFLYTIKKAIPKMNNTINVPKRTNKPIK